MEVELVSSDEEESFASVLEDGQARGGAHRWGPVTKAVRRRGAPEDDAGEPEWLNAKVNTACRGRALGAYVGVSEARRRLRSCQEEADAKSRFLLDGTDAVSGRTLLDQVPANRAALIGETKEGLAAIQSEVAESSNLKCAHTSALQVKGFTLRAPLKRQFGRLGES